MNNAPERIWVGGLDRLCLNDSTAFSMANLPVGAGPNPMSVEIDGKIAFVPAARLPRWRPIAELPDEWTDTRMLIVQADRKVTAMTFSEADFLGMTHFLDFGGHSMPAYDGA